MKRNIIILSLMAVLVAGMLILAARESRRAAGGGQLAGGSVAVGKPAPDFQLEALDGHKLKLSEMRGKAVLVNFWATWCAPCRVEMPWFEELQKQYASQGFIIVGIAMDDAEPAEVAAFAHEMGVTYPIAMGKNEVSDAYGAFNLPTSIYVNRAGNVVGISVGLKNRSEIEDLVKKSLANQAAAR